MAKKKRSSSSAVRAAVKLKRRELCKGYIDVLTPENVTNSGKSDRGFMDSIGVRAAGLGSMFDEIPDHMDMFISNNAYARPGFATLQFELCPPLETSRNKPTTRENLMEYLHDQVLSRENSHYKAGRYLVSDSPHIQDPKAIPGGTTNADLIVLYWYERSCDAEGHDLPTDLTSKKQYAAMYFSGKGIVFIKCTNFERHDQVMDFMEIMSSIRFIANSPYHGFERGINPMTMTFGYAPRSASTVVPKLCFQCGESQSGTDIKQCSR